MIRKALRLCVFFLSLSSFAQVAIAYLFAMSEEVKGLSIATAVLPLALAYLGFVSFLGKLMSLNETGD